MSFFINSIDYLEKNENYSQKTYNSIHNLPSITNNARKCNIKNKIGIITPKISNDFSKNSFNNIYKIKLQNTIINNENNINNSSLYSNKEYIKKINYDSSEIMIHCKPMLNSTASKTLMKEYSLSKRYQEDKLILFPSIEESAQINKISKSNNNNNISKSFNKIESTLSPNNKNNNNNTKEIIKEEKDNNSEGIKEENEYDGDEEDDVDELEELIKYQERHLPVPLDKKDNEKFKILTIKKMKRLSMPPNKSVRKFGEEIETNYEKDFRISNAFSAMKKKKPVHSTRRLYSSNFILYKQKGVIERFMVFRDKDIGIYEYWQSHIHESRNDEDVETDEEQKRIASNFSISEIKEAFDYIKLNRSDSFINFKRYEYLFKENETEQIMEVIQHNLDYYDLSKIQSKKN